MYTKTLADGTFSLDGIPNGTYDVHINDVDSTVPGLAAVNPAFAALTVPAVVVTYGVVQDVHAQSLEPTKQTVTVTVRCDTGDDLTTGASPAISTAQATERQHAATGRRARPTDRRDSAGTRSAYTFIDVPAGCWHIQPGPADRDAQGHHRRGLGERPDARPVFDRVSLPDLQPVDVRTTRATRTC